MSSIVLELQSEIVSKKTPVDELLRKGLVIAKKLKLKEFEDWIRLELFGYTENDIEKIPKYRNVHGKIQGFNNIQGRWLDVIIKDAEVENTVTQTKIWDSVSHIQTLVGNDSDTLIIAMELGKQLEHILMNAVNMDSRPYFILYKADVITILDAVKNFLLDWTLKLEEDGILGNDMSFSEEEVKKANQTINNFHFHSSVSKSQFNLNSENSKLEN
jgi:hypothetical protein